MYLCSLIIYVSDNFSEIHGVEEKSLLLGIFSSAIHQIKGYKYFGVGIYSQVAG